MPPAYFPKPMPSAKKRPLPVYEVEELQVERRVQRGRFYVKKDGEVHEHERRQHVEAVQLATARKPAKRR